MSYVSKSEVGIALKQSALDRWRCEDYPEAYAMLKTASTQYCTDAGCIFIWRDFPNWYNEFVLHDALDNTDENDYHLLVIGKTCPDDTYFVGNWRYFKMDIKFSITYEGEVWLRS